MSRQKAFSFHGVPNIGRAQWHAQADDGTHVFSVWEDNMSGDYAEAHIHNHSVGRNQPSPMPSSSTFRKT
jgi:hypothetical protein